MISVNTDKALNKLSILFFIIFFCVAYFLIFYDVSLSDESYFLALAYQIVLGYRPFVDEISMIQGAALITYPIVKIYHSILGNIDGLAIFTHHIYLCFTGVLAWMSYHLSRHFLEKKTCLIIAMSFLFFPIAGYLNLGYYSLGLGCYILGAFLVAHYLLQGEQRKLVIFIAGICHSIAALCLPFLLLAVLPFALVVWWLPKKDKWILTFIYCISGLGFGALLMVSYGIYPSDLINSYYAMQTELPQYGMDKYRVQIFHYFTLWWQFLSFKITCLVFLLLFLWGMKKFPSNTVIITLLSIHPILFYINRGIFGGLNIDGHVLYMGLLAPIFYLNLGEKTKAKIFMFTIWVPVFCSAILSSFFSLSYLHNAGTAMIGGAFVSTVFLFLLATEKVDKKYPLLTKWVPIFAQGMFLVACLYAGPFSPPRMDMLKSLTLIKEGPFAGILTSEKKAKRIQQFSNDIGRYEKPNRYIIFHPCFPGGYLLSNMRTAGYSIWGQNIGGPTPRAKKMIDDKLQRNFVAVVMRNTNVDYLNRYLSSRFEPKIVREEYIIYAE